MPFFVTLWLNCYGINYRTERLNWQENFIETKHLPSQHLEDVALLTDSEIARKVKMLDT
jgi:hypothetical protein